MGSARKYGYSSMDRYLIVQKDVGIAYKLVFSVQIKALTRMFNVKLDMMDLKKDRKILNTRLENFSKKYIKVHLILIK